MKYKENHPLYGVWRSMKRRCYEPTNQKYRNYGGRGIRVCERWLDFTNFIEDMRERPPGFTIERIDNDGDYTPQNCKWASYTEQNRNKRTNRRIQFQDLNLTLSEWAQRVGIPKTSLFSRLIRGWSVERALSTPALYSRHSKKS